MLRRRVFAGDGAGFNGGAVQNNFNANFASQETLTTLSADTGGKAFLDSNDFCAGVFAQVAGGILRLTMCWDFILRIRSGTGRYRKADGEGEPAGSEAGV